MKFLRVAATSLGFLVMIRPCAAHEVWIEPLAFEAEAKAKIMAQFKIGDRFEGVVFPHLPSKTIFSGILDEAGIRPLTGLAGTVPGINEATRSPGLQILSYESVPQRMTFTQPGKFRRYLLAKGLGEVWQSHQLRGLRETGFSEAYSRCAKALVMRGVGKNPEQRDVPTGLTLEWVAKTNPFALMPGKNTVLRAQLLWKGEPRPNATVTVFHRGAKAAVKITKLRSDRKGEAKIPIRMDGTYMIEAVHMIPWTAEPGTPWRSYWSTLTFHVASRQKQ